MKPFKLMVQKSDQSKKDLKPYAWKTVTISSIDELIFTANRFKVLPIITDYRSTKYKKKFGKVVGTPTVLVGSSIILVDVDSEDALQPILSKLDEYEYIKVPSSGNVEFSYKWHIFILLKKPLSKNHNKAKAQILKFYDDVLEGTDYDRKVAGDSVRYFAPATANFKHDTKKFLKASKVADTKSLHHLGKKYKAKKVKVDEYDNDSTPSIFSGDVEYCDAPKEGYDFEPTLDFTDKHNMFFLKDNTPIPIDGNKWTTPREIYNAGGVDSNRLGCPGCNQEHNSCISTAGYGFVSSLDENGMVLKCGGNACDGLNYVYKKGDF